jgi:hypothetical protein
VAEEIIGRRQLDDSGIEEVLLDGTNVSINELLSSLRRKSHSKDAEPSAPKKGRQESTLLAWLSIIEVFQRCEQFACKNIVVAHTKIAKLASIGLLRRHIEKPYLELNFLALGRSQSIADFADALQRLIFVRQYPLAAASARAFLRIASTICDLHNETLLTSIRMSPPGKEVEERKSLWEIELYSLGSAKDLPAIRFQFPFDSLELLAFIHGAIPIM